MKQLVITYNDSGDIRYAGVHDIQNAASYETDGFLVYDDGRIRPLQRNTVLYDPSQPWTADLLSWWRDGKYYVDPATQSVYAVEGWTPSIPEPAPTPEPELSPSQWQEVNDAQK